MQVISKSLSMNGFIVSNLHGKYEDEFYKTIPTQLASGQLKYDDCLLLVHVT
jgi:NADPH-dependent curcumin reductase CurA